MRKVILVHGALKRKSTKHYMEELAAFLAKNGFEPFSFYWSGYPVAGLVKKASLEFIDFFRSVADSATQILCKSVGADVVNCILSGIDPQRVIKVAPAYVVSNSLFSLKDSVTLTLERDRFLQFWSKFRIVHSLDNHGVERHYIIKNEPGVTHHSINFNIPVEILGIGKMRIYDFYRMALEGRLGDLKLEMELRRRKNAGSA